MFAQDGTPWFALPDLCGVLGIDDIKSTVKLLAEYECVAAMLPMSAGQRELCSFIETRASQRSGSRFTPRSRTD
jgi:prophage antirepressor-like protein